MSNSPFLHRTQHAPLIRILLLAFLLLAFFLRVFRLDVVPPGIHFDEGANGVDAMRVWQGITPIFFPENNGREPLFIYIVSLFIGLLDNSTLALRLPAAFAGTLAVASTYTLGRKLLGNHQGLLGAAFLAVTFWTFSLSRISYRANLLLALLPIWLFFFWKCRQQSSLHRYVIAGLLLAAIQYTYIAARFVPILAGILALDWRRHLTRRGLLIGAGVAVVVTIPLGLAIYFSPAEGMTRARQLWLFSRPSPWSLLWYQFTAHLAMFGFAGDPIWLHNIPMRPPIQWFIAPFCLAGVVLGWRNAGARALFWLVAVLIWPGVLAVSLELVPPNHLRVLAIAPAIFLLVGHGIMLLVGRWHVGWALLIGLALVTADGALSVRDYQRWQESRQSYEQYDADMTTIAAKIEARPETAFVIPLSWGWPRSNYWSIDYMTEFNTNYVVVERPFEIELPTYEQIGLVRWLAGMHGDADPQHRLEINLRLHGYQPEGKEEGTTYQIEYYRRQPALSRSTSIDARTMTLEGGVQFTKAVVYCFWPEGEEKEQVAVDLTWQSSSAYPVDLSASLRLVQPENGSTVAQVDSWLLNANGRAARRWETPDMGVQFFEFSDVDIPPGSYEVWVIPYETETLQPVPLAGGESSYTLGRVTLPLCTESP